MMKIFTLLHGSIPYKPNGLVNSVIRRCNVFNKFEVENTLLVYDWNVNCRHNIKNYKDSGYIHTSIDVKYMYSDLAGESELPSECIDHTAHDEASVAVQDENKKNIYRCYENGLYTMYKCFSDENKLVFIDYLETDFSRTKREYYDVNGYNVKTEYMNKDNKPGTIVYYRYDGSSYLTETKNVHGKTTGFIYFGKETNLTFSSHDELFYFWLKNYVFNSVDNAADHTNFLISEYAFKRKVLHELSRNSEKLKVVYTFHNNHFKAPHHYGSEILPQHKDIFDNLRSVDGVVFLTEQQTDDVQKQFGPLDNIFSIPHHAPRLENISYNKKERDVNRIVMLSRFDMYSKRQDEAIKAVSIVKDKFPNVRFDIYGHGPDEKKIRDLIASLNLHKWINLKGATEDPYGVFSSAGIMLMPSRYEGQGLTLMEAMSVGCVPVVYRFKYGSEAIISSMENGIICDKDSPEILADNICYLLENKKELTRISMNSQKIVESFSESRLFNDWISVFNQIDK